jgi:AraC-like DNA-binding protein
MRTIIMYVALHSGAIPLPTGAREGNTVALANKASQSYRVTADQPRRLSTVADGWQRQQLPDECGECYSEGLALAPDLMLLRSCYRPSRTLLEDTASPHNRPMLVLTFGLEGDSGYLGADGAAVAFRAGHTTVTSFQVSQGERRYPAGSRVSQLRLLVGEELLGSYLGAARARQLLGNGHLRQLAFEPTSAASLSLAKALSAGPADRLQRHIHGLSLLAEQLKHLSPPEPPSHPRFSADDLEKLERVRDIMGRQLDQPLTVAYLCAAVGLNEFKLKQGLHYRFNSTPQRMLLELRMHRAHALLEGGCQVAQAAYQVGYRHPHNFTSAFARFFGKTPKSVFGKRR